MGMTPEDLDVTIGLAKPPPDLSAELPEDADHDALARRASSILSTIPETSEDKEASPKSGVRWLTISPGKKPTLYTKTDLTSARKSDPTLLSSLEAVKRGRTIKLGLALTGDRTVTVPVSKATAEKLEAKKLAVMAPSSRKPSSKPSATIIHHPAPAALSKVTVRKDLSSSFAKPGPPIARRHSIDLSVTGKKDPAAS